MSGSPKLVRAADGSDKVLVDVADFQALLDAAAVAKHGMPDVTSMVDELRAALASEEGYVNLEQLLTEYDAVHGSG